MSEAMKDAVEQLRKGNARFREMVEHRGFTILSEDQLAEALLSRAREFDQVLDFLRQAIETSAALAAGMEEAKQAQAQMRQMIDELKQQRGMGEPPPPKPKPDLRIVKDQDPDPGSR